MLACFAEKGWNVIGVDINEINVKSVNKGLSPIYEPRVNELISTNREKISATLDQEQAVINSSVSFVIVPTPSVEDGSFTLKYVRAVTQKIAKALAKKLNTT